MSDTENKFVSFKDVQIAYLLGGIEQVKALDASRSVLIKALKELQAQGRKVDSLEEHLGVVGRGRTGPSVGDTREYKAQQVTTEQGEGLPFIRLPLAPLGVAKKDKVRVLFHADKIVVSRA